MKIFINERSLHLQYGTIHDFIDAVNEMCNVLSYLVDLPIDKEVFKSNSFFYSPSVGTDILPTSIKENPKIHALFMNNWQRIGAKSWEPDRLHSPPHTYEFSSQQFCDTSVGEAAEVKSADNQFTGFLLNFFDSIFENPNQDILKNAIDSINVDCNDSIETIYSWLVSKGLVIPSRNYDSGCKYPPRDEQTILIDHTLFSPTKFRNQGRRIYKHLLTGQKWVVDNLHYGLRAHIEVFDPVGDYVGESPISEIKITPKPNHNKKPLR